MKARRKPKPKAVCPRAWAHREGVFCKTCGEMPEGATRDRDRVGGKGS